MKYNTIKKYKAFTLAELMVIMAVLTVLMAAFSPIFTAKYKMSADSVWSMLSSTSYGDIVSDAPNKALLQESFIGITPISGDEIRSNSYFPFSKVNIRSIANLNGSPQKQIEFRYNQNRYGYLFAGNRNFLLGGLYSNLTIGSSCSGLGACAEGNSAYGSGALSSLTTGNHNTALGYKTLSEITRGSNNTAAGYSVGSAALVSSAKGNTLFGYLKSLPFGNYNTLIGNLINSSSSTKYVTAVGSNVDATNSEISVALGNKTNVRGTGNTAVGAYSLKPSGNLSNGYSYTTAIGYNSCSGLSDNAKYKTCVGGDGVTSEMSADSIALYNDQRERVFIGGSTYKNGANGSAAALEIHNIANTTNSSNFSSLGRETVVVNGNLIVRGQPYFLSYSPSPFNNDLKTGSGTSYPALMGYSLWNSKGASTTFAPLIADEGFRATKKLPEINDSATMYRLHESYKGREHCICSYSCNHSDLSGFRSYDWTSFKNFSKIIPDYYEGGYYYYRDNDYCNKSTGDDIILDKAHGLVDYGSCCPILTNDGYRVNRQDYSSDARLKNVLGEYNSGLNALKKITVYNYKFKNDSTDNIHVGVIAQSLKRIFPNSVTKNKEGYYQIRWDEMFFSSINAIKELNSKVSNLCSKVSSDISRIKSLKTKNAQLEKRLDILSKELDKLEKK